MKNPILPDGLPSPSFILDENLLRANLELIKDVEEKTGAEFILALKGFAMWSAFPILNSMGFCKATASSAWEARLAMEELGSPAHTYCPVYTNEDIEEIASMSSHISFNSMSQFRHFAQKAKEVNANISLGIRVNPEVSLVDTELYNPCRKESRLGVTEDELPNIPDWPMLLEGLHCHALCEASAEKSKILIESFEKKFGKYLPLLKWVNFGGGHLITRKDYDLQVFIECLKGFKSRHPNLKVYIEPGSAFAWQTGFLLCTVLDIVERKNTNPIAIVNVSFAAHMPDCLEMPYKPRIIGAIDADDLSDGLSLVSEKSCLKLWHNALEPSKYTYKYGIGGNSCLAGDQMGYWLFPKKLKIGDMLLFDDMIHYTMVKTTTFNGLKHPAICLIKNSKLIYKHSFTYSDFKNRLS